MKIPSKAKTIKLFMVMKANTIKSVWTTLYSNSHGFSTPDQLDKTTYPHTKSNTPHYNENVNPIDVVCGILLVYMRNSLLAMLEYLPKSNPLSSKTNPILFVLKPFGFARKFIPILHRRHLNGLICAPTWALMFHSCHVQFGSLSNIVLD
jgi:hypothetical protein